jgi:flagellar hook-associated protein 3 FlgL
MSIGPILPGRIPIPLIARQLSARLDEGTRLLQTLQDQVATGQRFFRPGEAPAAALNTITLQKALERQTQFQTNVQTDLSLLIASEVALNSVADALNRAKGLVLEGAGNTITPAQRDALAAEAAALLRDVVGAANMEFRGRYLFGGSQGSRPPFEIVGTGSVLYHGDALSIESFADRDLLLSNNVDGATAFGPFTQPITRDINPALTLETRLADLHRGAGIDRGPIVVTVTDGVSPQTASIDLSAAETIGDVQTLIQNAFSAGPISLTVDVDPATNSGLRLTPSTGTVAVSDVTGRTTAADLGIASAAQATVLGSDLDPRLTLQTTLASLNGGTGIGPTAGAGLVVTNGAATRTIDLSSAQTVEDLFNLLQQANLNVSTTINAAGDGLAISSRLSGEAFSIGENSGQNATLLGIRTLTADTPLADLNLGNGVPVTALDETGALLPAELEITRRNGTTVTIDLAGSQTVQDVLDRISAVDPGVLTASLTAVGNGIALVDNDGVSTGPLSVADSELARTLGLVGTENSGVATAPLVGSDVNPQRTAGVFGILADLHAALETGNIQDMERLDRLINVEADRLNSVRGDVGARLRALDQVSNRLADENVLLQESLSKEFDTDFAETITRIAQTQAVLEAVMRIAAQTSQLSLLSFL